VNFVALKMLTGDRAKYLGLIFAIAFSSFLMAHQASIFAGIMDRTRSQIVDITDANVWVMDRNTEYFDEVSALTDDDLYRVRGVTGVKWAVPLFKGQPRAKSPDGKFRVVILLGLDDATLVGTPHKMLLGSASDLRQPDAAIIDEAGYRFFFPDGPLQLGNTLEMNDHRVRLVGICDASAPFTNFPVVFTRYSQALNYVGRERNLLSFVLAKPEAGVSIAELSTRIQSATGLRAMSSTQFGRATIVYYLKHTGIPINFGLTVAIALIVGTVVAGQTFYIFTMIVLQALLVGAIGYSLGMGMAAGFFSIFVHKIATRGIVLLWQVIVGDAAIVLLIVIVASLVSIRKVLVLEPAVVFRG